MFSKLVSEILFFFRDDKHKTTVGNTQVYSLQYGVKGRERKPYFTAAQKISARVLMQKPFYFRSKCANA